MNAHQRISHTLVEDIQSGKYAVGDVLPTERELMDRFEVSRNTVREALRTMNGDGFIARRQGSRTVVVSSSKVGAFINVVSTLDDLSLYIAETRSVHLASEHVLVSERVASIIGCRPQDRRLRVQFLRWRRESDEPLCYSEIFIEPEFESVIDALDGSLTVYNKIESCFDVTLSHVEQEIEAIRADPNISSRLNVEQGSPVLEVQARYFLRGGKLAEVSLSHFPESRYRLKLSLSRDAGDHGMIRGLASGVGA